jgi:hypothetical protein
MDEFEKDIAGIGPPKPGAPGEPPSPAPKTSDLDYFESITAEAPTEAPRSVFKAEALADAARVEAEAKAKAIETAAKTGALLKKGVLAGAAATAKAAGTAATKAKETDPALRKKIGIGLAIAVALGLVGTAVHRTLESQRDYAQDEREAELGFDPIPGDVRERYATETEELAFSHAMDARRAWIADRFGPDQDPPMGVHYAWTRVVLKSGGWDYCLMRQRDSNATWPSEPDEFDFEEFKSCVTKLADGSPLANAIIDRESRWTAEQQSKITTTLEALCRDQRAGWQACTEAVNAPDLPWRDCRDQQDPADFKIGPFKVCVQETIVRPAAVTSLLTIGSACDRSLARDEKARCEAFVEASAGSLAKACATDIQGDIERQAVIACTTAKWQESERVPAPEPEPIAEPVAEVETPAPKAVEPPKPEVVPVPPPPAAVPVVKASEPKATAVPSRAVVNPPVTARTERSTPTRSTEAAKPVAPKPEPAAKSEEELRMEAWFQQLEEQSGG